MTAQPEPDAGAETTSTVRRVALHVVRCNTCRHAVESIGDEADVTGFLEAQRDVDDTPVIERVFGTVAKVGTAALADLVYELSKAVLFEDGNYAKYSTPDVHARPIDVIRADLHAFMARLHRVAAECLVADVADPVDEETRRAVAGMLLDALHTIEGRTSRYLLATGNALITDDDAPGALVCLREVFDNTRARMRDRELAADTMARALFKDKRFAEVEALVREVSRTTSVGPILRLYEVASILEMGDADRASEELSRFRERHSAFPPDDVRRADLLIRFIADRLRRDATDVVQLVGAHA